MVNNIMKENNLQPAISTDDHQVLIISSHVLIKDKTANKIILSKRVS